MNTQNSKLETPEVGSGATILWGRDRVPATVLSSRRTASGKLVVTVQEDNYVRTDDNGICNTQSYDYSPNPQGEITTYYENKRGNLRERKTQQNLRKGTGALWLGERERFYDFEF